METEDSTSLDAKGQLQAIFGEAEKLQPKVEGGAPKDVKGAEVKEVKEEGKAPVTRSYSDEEWNKRQSAWDTRASEKDKEYQKAQETLKGLQSQYEELLGKSEEQKLADFLKTVEADGGDVPTAKRIVEAQREVSRTLREAKSMKSEWEAKSKVAEAGLKSLAAEELIKTYELDPKEFKEKLLAASTPVEMENIALKAAKEKSAETTRVPEKLDPGVGVPKGVELDKLPPSIALGFLIEQDEARRRQKI